MVQVIGYIVSCVSVAGVHTHIVTNQPDGTLDINEVRSCYSLRVLSDVIARGCSDDT